MRTFVGLLVALAILVTAPAAAGRSIYVDPAGSDAASGTALAPLGTVSAAIRRASPGDRIVLAAGAYPAIADDVARTGAPIEIQGQGPTRTQVAGLRVSGGQRLTFHHVRFTAPVVLQDHVIRHDTQPAAVIEIDNAEVVTSGTCMTIKGGAQAIAVTDSRLRGCYSGIVGPGNPYISRGIRIERNLIEQVRSDGIQFGSWRNVRIADNLIREIRDPAGAIHNDAIQLTGNAFDVVIESNQLQNSSGQLVFIQDALGPIEGLQVVNNVLSGAGAVALQSQGARRARFSNNTVAKAKDGGMWFRAGYPRGGGVVVVPEDAVVTNNVAPTMRFVDGALAATAAGNVVLEPAPFSGLTVPRGATAVTWFGFADARSDNYRLLASSPARALGTTVALPEHDITDAPRTAPVPGAYN